jgi:hypothetical protein
MALASRVPVSMVPDGLLPGYASGFSHTRVVSLNLACACALPLLPSWALSLLLPKSTIQGEESKIERLLDFPKY